MFPLTLTLHTPAQLSAVLRALQPELKASDFASPAVGAAYEEASARVAQRDAATPKAAAPTTARSPRRPSRPAQSPPCLPRPERQALPLARVLQRRQPARRPLRPRRRPPHPPPLPHLRRTNPRPRLLRLTRWSTRR
jgi:hypothetical protein